MSHIDTIITLEVYVHQFMVYKKDKPQIRHDL